MKYNLHHHEQIEPEGGFFISRYAVHGGWVYCAIDRLTNRGGTGICFVPDPTVELIADNALPETFNHQV